MVEELSLFLASVGLASGKAFELQKYLLATASPEVSSQASGQPRKSCRLGVKMVVSVLHGKLRLSFVSGVEPGGSVRKSQPPDSVPAQ